ncbi:DUF2628 domain-containing protein [Alteromonadaceae bacterium M269]|nr:DUF2628 domain-containing protein [Alteromonadaceae bacterium M269]
MSSYKIVFKGEIKSGIDRALLIPPLCKFLKLPESKGHLLFSGKALALRKGLSHEKAIKVYDALDKIGVITHLIVEEKVTAEISTQRESSLSSNKTQPTFLTTCPHCGHSLKEEPQKPSKPETDQPADYPDVKPSWKKIFSLYDTLDGRVRTYSQLKKHPAYDNLQFSERLSIHFSVWAFIFGPLYYFYRGLWSKAFLLLAVCLFVLSGVNLLAEAMSPHLFNVLSTLTIPIVFSQCAKFDYYRYKVMGETTYQGLPEVFQNRFIIAVLLLISTVFVIVSEPAFQQAIESAYTEVPTPLTQKPEDKPEPSYPNEAQPRDLESMVSAQQPAVPEEQSTQTDEKKVAKVIELSNGTTYYNSYADLETQSKQAYPKKGGVQLHAVN